MYMLQTLVVEIEAALNKCSLTHVSSDTADSKLITPSYMAENYFFFIWMTGPNLWRGQKGRTNYFT